MRGLRRPASGPYRRQEHLSRLGRYFQMCIRDRLSTVQMPSGVPVATVAINGAENAAILAVQILAGAEPSLAEALRQYKKDMEKKIIEKDNNIRKQYSIVEE